PLAIAARTACSTSLASRTFRVSTPSVSRFPHDLLKMAAFVAAIRIPNHPSNAVAERHKGELSRTAMRTSVDRLGSRFEGRHHSLSRPASRRIGHPRLGLRATLSLRPLSKHLHA